MLILGMLCKSDKPSIIIIITIIIIIIMLIIVVVPVCGRWTNLLLRANVVGECGLGIVKVL